MTIITGQNQILFSKRTRWSSEIESTFLKFYDIITISPVRVVKTSVGLKSILSKSAQLWSLFAIFGILIYIAIIAILRVFWAHGKAELGVWSEVTDVCSVMIPCLVILIETQFTQKYFADFLLLKQKTEHELLALCNREIYEHEKYTHLKSYQKMILIFFIFAWVTEIIYLFDTETDLLFRFYSWSLLLPITFTRLRFFQHRLLTNSLIFYLKMIRIKIQNAIDDISGREALAREQRLFQFTVNSRKTFNDLNEAMRIFTSIFRMTDLMNQMFGISLLIIIFEIFTQMLFYVFWLYSKLYHEDLNNLEGEHFDLIFK